MLDASDTMDNGLEKRSWLELQAFCLDAADGIAPTECRRDMVNGFYDCTDVGFRGNLILGELANEQEAVS